MPTRQAEFLGVQFDCLTFDEVRSRLAGGFGRYQYVVTPNVDHIVRLHANPDLSPLYDRASICVCDSRILKVLARFSGVKLPLVAGSDLTAALFESVIEPGDRIAVVGGSPAFASKLRRLFPTIRFYHYEAPMGLRENPAARTAAVDFIARTAARFIFIVVGSPQGEMIAAEAAGKQGIRGTSLCVGAALEFLTKDQRRAPAWVRTLGFEWFHRLLSDPKRLWRRYLVEGVAIGPIFLKWWLRKSAPSLRVLAILLAVCATAVFLHGSAVADLRSASAKVDRGSLGAAPKLVLALPPPNLLRPLSPQAATKANAARPFVARPDSPAAPFIIPLAQKAPASQCLAQAVYYEAGGEGTEGEKAVAQVVLNRVRNAAYPASICGVVYEGAQRQTGCQFSFTCDGSLARLPVGTAWVQARRIAEAALSGAVYAPVGHSTHYHADYVVPYWADSLDKSAQVGRHIFYRFRGALGSSGAFLQRYSGREPDPSAIIAGEEHGDTIDEQWLQTLAAEAAKQSPAEESVAPGPQLAADANAGTLIMDLNGSGKIASAPRATGDCKKSASSKISPLEPNKLKSTATGC